MEMYKPLHEEVHVPLYFSAEDKAYDEMNKIEHDTETYPKNRNGPLRTSLGLLGLLGEWIANEATGYGNRKREEE